MFRRGQRRFDNERCIPRYLYRAVPVRHPSPSPGLLPRFFQKEREKEMGGKNRSRKETTCNDYSRHRPRDQTLRESTIENRDRTLEEFPIRDSIPLKISREIGISFAGMFLHRGFRPLRRNFFLLFFFTRSREILVVPSSAEKRRKFSVRRLLLLSLGYRWKRSKRKRRKFWNEKW